MTSHIDDRSVCDLSFAKSWKVLTMAVVSSFFDFVLTGALMKIRFWIAISMLVMGMSTELCGETSGPSAESVRLFLMATYSSESITSDGTTGIRGLHFPGDRSVSELNNRLLKEVLPETLFFKTTISRPDWDYREVDILVAATRSHGVNTFQTTCIPPFTKFSSDFFEVFQACDMTKVNCPQTLANAIGELVQSVDPQMEFQIEDASQESVWAIHFLRAGKRWSTIHLQLNDSGNIEKVMVADRKKMRPYF